MTTPEILLVYDKECPVCDAYCRVVRVHESLGKLRLVNARENTPIMEDITRQRLDTYQGMVLRVDGVLYYGPDAIHQLSLMSSKSSVLNRINYWMFSSKSRSRLLYPMLRSGRNLLLKVLRKTKINKLRMLGNKRS